MSENGKPRVSLGWLAIAVAAVGAIFIFHEGQVNEATVRDLRATIRATMPSAQFDNTDPNQPGHYEFMGDQCTSDCSGHIAGWKWAVAHGVTSMDGCAGARSASFVRGCEIYVARMGYGPEPATESTE